MEASRPTGNRPQDRADAVRLEVASRTDVGCVRERNEDAVHSDLPAQVYIVADGMGGHGSGDVASAMAVSSIRDDLVTARPRLAALAAAPSDQARRDVTQLLELVIRDANRAVVDRSRREPEKHGMGSTVEVVVIVGSEAFVAHVGDSRTYLVRDHQARLLTTDHTVAEMMRNAGAMSGSEARISPMRSVLANAVGVTDEITVESVHLDLRAGDRLLICTDGLYDYFDDTELGELLADDPPDRVLDAMIELARTRGGHDNLTGVVVAVERALPAQVAVEAPSAVPDDTVDEPTRPVHAADLRPAQAGPSPTSAVPNETVDEATRPRAAVRLGSSPPGASPVPAPGEPAPEVPLAGMSSEAVAAFVERTIHEESRPITRPGWTGPTRER